MKIKQPVLSAVVISLVLHIAFFVLAMGVDVSSKSVDETKPKRVFRVKLLRNDIPVRKLIKRKKIDRPVETLKFEGTTMKKTGKPPMFKEKVVEKKMAKPKEQKMTELVEASVPKEFNDYLEETKDKVLVQKFQRKTRKSLLKKMEQPGNNVFATPADILKEGDVSEDFFDKMPGLTPRLIIRSEGLSGHDIDAPVGRGQYGSIIQKKLNPENLKEYLSYRLEIYQDAQDGEKYYKLSIRAGKKALELVPIPKEIVFLVDCSISTQPERLEEFKKGIRYCLSHLNSNDTFNIIAFKKNIHYFRPASVKSDEKAKREALRFVAQLTSGEKTDTYNALYKSINTKNARDPSYIILLSDGRPTKGVTDSRKLINDISALNNGKIAIFSFSGGVNVNRYLLDFIAYKNRGWAEYSYRTHLIGETMVNMYEKIRDPILINLRYYASGLENGNIFPKMLPDFFRNTEFTLYGKYTRATNFSLQLLGEFNGKANEFFIKGSLKKAIPGKEDIARGWAFNKIYYLIGLLKYGEENQELIKEIKFLSKKFNIKTPYGRRVFGN